MPFVAILIVIFVVLVIVFIGKLVVGVSKGKSLADNMKSDDKDPEWKIIGKVIEKTADTNHVKGGAFEFEYTIEWLIIECSNGERRKVRNVKPEEILVAEGDVGEFTLRGTTIYEFRRNIN